MTQTFAIMRACLESGTLPLALVALIALPLAIWALSRAATPAVRVIPNDRVRAIAAAAAATVPGASFVIAAIGVLVRAVSARCLEMPGGRAFVAVVSAALVLTVVRAIVRAVARERRSASHGAGAGEPSLRLHSVAVRVGVRVRQLPRAEPLVFLGGAPRATVIVSDGALARLNDRELAAALAHEVAHVRHGDRRLIATLLFFADFMPLSLNALIELYREAREFAADRAAVQAVDPLDLAAAILRTVSARRPSTVVALADACIHERLLRLTSREPCAPHSAAVPIRVRAYAAAQIALVALLAAAALVLPACMVHA